MFAFIFVRVKYILKAGSIYNVFLYIFELLRHGAERNRNRNLVQHRFKATLLCLQGVNSVPRIYLIDPTALVYLGEIYALEDQFVPGG